MSSIATDFLNNLLANQAFRIFRKEGGEVTNEHVEIVADERASVMGDTTREQDRTVRHGEEEGPQEQSEASQIQNHGDQGGVLEDGENEGTGEISSTPLETTRISQPPIGEAIQEEAARQQSGLDNASTPIRPVTALPFRPRSETPATEDDIANNPEFGTPDRSQGTPTTQGLSDSAAGSSTQDGLPSASEIATEQTGSALPEDDGMRELRKRVLLIQGKDVPTEEKARLMHELLTEDYIKSQIGQQMKSPSTPRSPTAVVSQERPTTPTSISNFSFWSGKDNSPEKGETVTFRLSADDLKPTYAPLPTPADAAVDGASDGGDEAQPPAQVFGCEHYKRNVKIQCITCNKWYTCRLCHDAVEDHVLPRRETKNMLCMICGTAQRAAEICTHCTGRAANYYCDVCHLWEDDPNRSIYHCNDCGICRVGAGLGKDFFHCKVGLPFPFTILFPDLTFVVDLRPLHEYLHGKGPQMY